MMTPAQKKAWYSLAVVATCLAVLAALIPVLGPARAQGGFGVMGLLGFSQVLFRGRRGEIVNDERDDEIRRRATMISHVVFWIVFIQVGVACPFIYGSNGAVPVLVVQYFLWLAFSLIVTVAAVATLVLYRLGRDDAA